MISIRKKQIEEKEKLLKTELENNQKKLMSFIQSSKQAG